MYLKIWSTVTLFAFQKSEIKLVIKNKWSIIRDRLGGCEENSLKKQNNCTLIKFP